MQQINQRLIIITPNGEIQNINLAAFNKSKIYIGRDSSRVDIFIPFASVSKVHGEFQFANNRMYYMDTNSRNGTYIESRSFNDILFHKQKYILLEDGAVLRIHSGTDVPVMLLYSEMAQQETWKSIALQNGCYLIGRSSECDISLKHPTVSRKHAIIESVGYGQYQITLLRERNHLIVNGYSVKKTAILQNSDIIRIANFQLIYTNGVLFYKTVTHGVSLDVCNINKIVGKGNSRKQILTNVNCHISSNEFVAIIGGSGAGKTTLMNAVSGFDNKIKGEVYFNGIDLHGNFEFFKNLIGYVPQQDIIYENLTLRKMLYYTAKMKMPSDTSKMEIHKRIDEVLEMIELTQHQNTMIRKLSGGQKKRASIAVEMLADPKLFFLDEPTSGLDPGTEKNLMQTLSKLAKREEKTIVMVTHTTQNLHLCDKVIFMGPGGRLCFCGTVQEAKTFFRTDDLVNIYNMIADNPEGWANQYRQYMGNFYQENQQYEKEELKQKNIPKWHQFKILVTRYLELIINDRIRLALLFLQPCIIAALLVVVSEDTLFDIYESTKSMMFALSCSAIWIGLFNSIQEICKERAILKREYMTGLNLFVYILSKTVVQVMIAFIQALCLVTVFLLVTAKNADGIMMSNNYLEIFITIWLTIMAAMAMGLVVSAITKSGDKAMVAAPFLLIIQLLFSGILFELEGISEWISYLTISRWSVEALGGIAHLNELDLRLQEDFPVLEHEAEDFFNSTVPHELKAWGILLIMMFVFLIISTLALRTLKKDNR